MPDAFTTTGGAHVGWINASWPFAKLSATPEKLTLSISVLGTYTFAPERVSTIEKYVMIPVLASGVRIHHCSPDCPVRVIFWCLQDPDTVLQGIAASGFRPAAPSVALQPRSGMAIRWSAALIAIAVWNGLFLLGGWRKAGPSADPGSMVLAPLIFLFVFAIGTLKSAKLQRIILKPGRSAGELRAFLGLAALISGLLLCIFSVVLACGGFK